MVVLTDLLFDVDDDRMNDEAPQRACRNLPLTADRARADLERRAGTGAAAADAVGAESVARRASNSSAHPNIRGVLCQVSGAQDQDSEPGAPDRGHGKWRAAAPRLYPRSVHAPMARGFDAAHGAAVSPGRRAV